jgi:hypothetical protein
MSLGLRSDCTENYRPILSLERESPIIKNSKRLKRISTEDKEKLVAGPR